jgi:hypothetical protein
MGSMNLSCRIMQAAMAMPVRPKPAWQWTATLPPLMM